MSDLTSIVSGGVHWQIEPQHRHALLDSAGLRLAEWRKHGHASIVKKGPHCSVYRVMLPGLDFYLKHYHLYNTRAWLRQLLRPAKARSEFARLQALVARGLPTVAPLGVGESRVGPGDSFLLTYSLLDTEPLGTFIETTLPTWPNNRRTRLRSRLAEALGKLLANLHASGVVHHDLHANNLLIRIRPNDTPALFLIDLHAVRIGPPLAWPARRDNLVVLNRWFILRSDRSDRLRFWEAYTQTWRGAVETLAEQEYRRDLARDLEEETWRSNREFWARRDLRCRVTNKYYERVNAGPMAGHALRGLDAAVLNGLLADPDEPFRRPGVLLLKDSPSSTVAELEICIDGVPRQVIWKRFRVTSWSDPCKALLRTTSTLRSWVFGHGLRERGLPTPRPLLVLHRRRLGLCRDGYLLTEKVPDAVDLHTFVQQLGSRPVPEQRSLLRGLIDRLGRVVRELHHRNLSQRDLKASNILISSAVCPWSAVRDSDANDRHVWLIDLVGISLRRELTRSRKLQNLARLHASFQHHPGLTRTDRLRFLRVYLQWGLFGQVGWKRWWQAIEQAAQTKTERNHRNGRLLA